MIDVGIARRILPLCLGILWGVAELPAEAQSNAKEPSAPKPEPSDAKARVGQLSAGGPQLAYERFRRQIEIQVAEQREKQIEGLKRLLAYSPEEKELPDLTFRLGELYFEKAQFYFFRANEAEDLSLRSEDPSKKRDALTAKKEAEKQHKLWLAKALATYKEIREKYPKYTRMPEVLFALGQAYWSERRFQSSIEAYAELIRNFPDNPLVAEAWLAFGEFYFNDGNIQKALRSYEKAAEDKRSRVYGFALYKQAWCYYNLAEWRQALRRFEATVLYSQLSEQLSGENKIALGREAQKDWVRAYAHVGSERRASYRLADLLEEKSCGSDRCYKLLEQLAQMWMETGNFDKSAYLYQELIRMRPDSSRVAFFQGRIVDLVSRSGDKDRVIAETRKLVSVYEKLRVKLKSLPKAKQESAQEDVEEAEILAETTIRRLGQLWNHEALKTRRNETYKQAMQMYEMYLKLFPTQTYAYEMRFQLADLLYRLESFDKAAKNYKETVLADPKGKYLVDAASDNIRALEEHIRDRGLRKPKLKGDKPVPIPPEKQRLIEACDRYEKFVPVTQDPDRQRERVAVRFKAARTFFDYNHTDEALKRLDAIVTQNPSSEQAEYAANLVIDVYNIKGDWQQLYGAASRYLASQPLVRGRPKLAEELSSYGEYAKFKMVQILEEKVKQEKGELGQVAAAYEGFYREFPSSKNADKALFNASVAYDRAGQAERANELRRRLLQEYPNSPLTKDVSLYLAKQYEERTQYGRAAQAYLAFSESHPEDPRARNALYNAAVFSAGVGRVRSANKLREDYLKRYGGVRGGKKESADIYWAMAEDLDRTNRIRDAVAAYADFAKKFSRDDRMWEARWRQAELIRTRLRRPTEADKLERELLGIYNYRTRRRQAVPDVARQRASQAEFRIVDEDRKAYRRLRIHSPNVSSRKSVKRFQRTVAEKAKARQHLIRRYTRVVTKYQQADSTIAALYRIAQAWDDFVEGLVKLRCPFRDEEACMAFKSGLEQQAEPSREAAYQAYKTCVDKSNELNSFTSYSNRCVKALEKLAPDSYPEVVEKQLDEEMPMPTAKLKANGLQLRSREMMKSGAGS